MKRLWREPLLHFLLIGAVLFLLYEAGREGGGDDTRRIIVSAGQVEQLYARFRRTWLRPPTREELDALIESHVRDEVFYREAVAMGLDRGDTQVRKRMRLKLEFLLEDLSVEAPDDTVLEVFLQQHRERFSTQPRVSFRQVYLDPDRHDDPVVAARVILADLQAGADPDALGDTTMLPRQFNQATQAEIARSFGEDFAGEVAGTAPGGWAGPLYSGYGLHLVSVSEREAARLPELSQIREQVEREYLAEQRNTQKEQAYRQLREGYEIIIEPAMPGDVLDGGITAAASGHDGQ
jgi:hypothetical protein